MSVPIHRVPETIENVYCETQAEFKKLLFILPLFRIEVKANKKSLFLFSYNGCFFFFYVVLSLCGQIVFRKVIFGFCSSKKEVIHIFPIVLHLILWK